MRQDVLRKIRLAVAIIWGAVLFATLLWLIAFVIKYGLAQSRHELKELIQQFSGWMPLVYLLIFSLRGLLFIPATILILVGGTLFSQMDAFFLALTGLVISATIVFLLARFVGRDFIKAHESPSFRRIDQTLAKRGFFTTLVLIIMPFVPIDTIAVVAGVTAISFADFFLGLFLGSVATVLPIIFLTNSLHHPFGIGMTVLSFLLILLVSVWAWRHPHFEGMFRVGVRDEKKVKK